MKLLKKLDNNLLSSIIVYGLSILGFVISSFLISTSYKDIPFGFLFSGGVIGTLYLISCLLGKIDTKNEKSVWSIVAINIRLLVIIGVMIIIAFMNYRWNIKLFNLFVFIGVYTVGIISFILLNLFKKGE